jgi:hypothetical protein
MKLSLKKAEKSKDSHSSKYRNPPTTIKLKVAHTVKCPKKILFVGRECFDSQLHVNIV